MEFHQVVQSVCRTAAATAAASSPSTTSPAARLALASGSRPVLSSSLLHHHRSFTTNSTQRHEAAALAARPQQSMARPPPVGSQIPQRAPTAGLPPRPTAAKSGLLAFRAAVPKAATPPRFPGRSGTPPVAAAWANPAQANAARAPVVRGRVSGAGSPATTAILGMAATAAADMQRSTGETLRTWSADAFRDAAYGREPELRLRPSTGRTVEVQGNVDFARGLRLLQSITAVNKLRTDVRLQRFHERPALKRKRLLRERWRARFRDGFAATKKRVFELKAQGW